MTIPYLNISSAFDPEKYIAVPSAYKKDLFIYYSSSMYTAPRDPRLYNTPETPRIIDSAN